MLVGLNMAASLLDGKQLALSLQSKLKKRVATILAQGERAPSLAVILVGENAASEIYVKNKCQACAVVGFSSHAYNLPADTSEDELLALVHKLNERHDIDGILVQLPLPPAINPHSIIEAINPYKDVDGFHPYNVGRLVQRHPLLRPCTPFGIMNLLEFYKISLKGQHAVVIGASNIVGRPMALEFLAAGATVTICHSETVNLEKHVREAEIIVTATGICDLIQIDWLNEKQIIIDVGIHRLPNGKLRGDIDFVKAEAKVAWITPVPGGVGPMTITALLYNTLIAAEHLAANQRS